MKRKIALLPAALTCFVILLTVPLESDAQIWKNLGKKLEEKIEKEASKRAERKIDQAINKSFDKLEESADGAIKGRTFDQGQLEAMMGAMNADVTLQDTYDFGIGITYETLVAEGGRKSGDALMTMWFSDQPYLGMQATDGKEQMFTVLHDGQIVIFMENQKSYMAIGKAMFEAMGSAAAKYIEEEGEDDHKEVTLTRLPDETVLGQRCKVYLAKTEDGESRVWYTDELGVDMLKGFAENLSTLTRQNFRQQMPAGMEDLSGVMLKMEFKDLESGEIMTMEAKTIHREGKRIKSADYKRAGAN